MQLRQSDLSLYLALCLAGLSAGIGHAADPVEELKFCARMSDRDARFACYDALGQRVLGDEPVADQAPPETVVPPEVAAIPATTVTTEPTAATQAADLTEAAASTETTAITQATDATETETDVPSLPDDLGGTSFGKKSESGEPEHKGFVTSCKKGADSRYYFFFESGQVWRQSNIGRHRFKDCNFVVTIRRDAFGYKMQIDGETSKIRVARRK